MYNFCENKFLPYKNFVFKKKIIDILAIKNEFFFVLDDNSFYFKPINEQEEEVLIKNILFNEK